MNKLIIRLLIASILVTLTSCSKDEPAKMLWDVTATTTENVKAVFNPGFYHQIQITADGDSGEVTLKCTNYNSLNIIDTPSGREYIDSDCHFTAKVTESGMVKITFDKMPDVFKERKSFLQIDGTEGKNSNTTTIEITRIP